MPVISLTEAENLPDILSGEQFRLNLGEIPGIGDAGDLAIKCQAVELPGRTNEAFEVSIGSFIRVFSGRNRFSNTMAISFVEDIQMGTLTKLRGWLEQIRGTESSTAIGNIADYATNPELSVFDQAGNEIDTVLFTNFFITAVNPVQLSVNENQPMLVQADFRYDYVTYNGVSIR